MSESIKYTDGYKYQLNEEYQHRLGFKPNRQCSHDYITLYEDGRLVIKKGYAWDGPSGPTVDTKSSMRGALVHDALYQLMRLELLNRSFRTDTDKEMKRVMYEDGMWRWRVYLWYRSVSKFAGFASKSKNKKKIITAP